MDDFKAMLARARAQRANLDQLIAVLEKIVGEGNGDSLLSIAGMGGTGGPTEFPPGTFHNLNLAEASKKYLKLAGLPARSTDDIAQALEKGGFPPFSKDSLATVLLRAAKGRSIAKVGKGYWGLPEWYPKEG